jgi:hypothetical protein
MHTLAYPSAPQLVRTGRARARALRVGAAGLGYTIAAGVENMELLRAPVFGSTAGEIRAAYADRVLAGITVGAGALSLALYAVFAVGLTAGHRGGPWRVAALAGGLGGPALAALGVAAAAVLAASGVDELSDAATRGLFDLQLTLRMLAGPFMALFLLGSAAGGALPGGLALAARACAVPLALTPLAAVSGTPALFIAASVAFGLHASWIWVVSLHLCTEGATTADRFRRAAFLMLVLAAGLIGLALLAVPAATGAFFAWTLRPAPLAAFAGGVYVGSAVVYAAALRLPLAAVRSLLAAAVVLSVSVFAITLVHLEVFDLGRLQAWAWLFLFAGFAAVTTVLLARGGGPRRPGVPLAAWVRCAFALLAAALGALGVALWLDPVGTGAAGPFALPPLGGRFAGSWIVMLAVLAGWGAAHGRRDEARLPALALVALPAGALCAAIRTAGDVGGAYVAALAVLTGLGLALRAATR